MYRITEKLPPLSWQQGASILTKCKTEKALLQNSRRCYDTNASRKSGIGKPILLVLGTAAAGIGGSIAYAKYDPKFRKTLDDYVPGSDSFIKFISQEEKSYVDNVKDGISNASSSAVNKIYSLVGFGEKSEQSAIEPPPPLVVTKTVKSQPEPAPAPKKEPVTASKPEKEPIAKNSPKQAAKVEVEPTKKASQPPKEKPKQKPEKSEDFKKYDIPDLEKKAIDITEKAILAINSAVNELRTYREEVATLIEQSVQKDDINLWFKIKEKSEQKEKSIEKAEKIGKKAMKKIEHLALLISDEKTDIDETTRSKIENNIKNVLNDLIYTKAVFSKEKVDSSVTEKYAKKVEESRQALSKELGVLFPSLVVDTDVIISEEQLDLFVMYTCQLLNFYQKELQKLETIGKAKLEKIIEQSKAGNQDVNEDILELEKDLLKRNFTQELLKTELKLKLQFEDDLKSHLRRQAEVYKDHLDEVVYLKDQEAERKLKHSIDEKIEQMQLNYNIQLAKIIGRMKGIDFALKERAMAEKQAKHSQLLWTACQALNAAIKEGTNTKPWEDQLKPLEKQVKAISKAAAEEDELVNVVVESIPKEALSRGVFNEVALRDRFLNVERLAIRLANLPAGFVSIPRMFLSYLQSFLLVNLSKTIPPEELADEPFDVSALNNYDILFRARYWLDRGDVLQTLKYMNLLKGASRAIASEWMNEARILLETQQAADVLLWHAVNSSLIYLENSS